MATRPSRAGSDPFPPTADPAAYVPRTATESVLVQLEMAVDDGARVMLLAGAPGSGRTLLLHVLAGRLDGRLASLHVPYSKFTPRDLCQWLLASLGEPCETGSEHPELALRARISRDACDGFPPKLLMLDDAGWMPPKTLERVLELQADYPDALRTLLVVPESYGVAPIERAGLACERVSLEGGMDAGETQRYLRARLDHGAAEPGHRARVEQALDQLYRQSDGNPGRLHAAVSVLLLRDSIPPRIPNRPSEPRFSADLADRPAGSEILQGDPP